MLLISLLFSCAAVFTDIFLPQTSIIMSPDYSNASHLPSVPPSSSPDSVSDFIYECLNTTVGFYTIMSFVITVVLVVLPLCVLVIRQGYQQHWKQFSGTKIGHSDLFTYHMVLMELINIIVSIFCLLGICTRIPILVKPFVYIFPFCLFGQTVFHILTCFERYLAVIHPITYVSLKNVSWIRIRNAIIAIAWVFSALSMGTLLLPYGPSLIILSFFIVGSSFLAISFCSISVLCSLIRPGPAGRDRRQVNQTKLRAFHTIISILAVLLLRIAGCILTIIPGESLNQNGECGMWLAVLWFSLPSSLILPLLFLQRAQKLPICRKTK